MNAFVGHHVVGDRACDSLDEFAWWPGQDVGGALGQCAVVEGVGKVIAGRRGRQIDPHRDVDDEVLAVAPFVVEHAVVSANGQAAQLDSVSHVDHASSTLSASTEARTSCTRTPHAPYMPARAEITAVAVSRPAGGGGSPFRHAP